MTTLTPLIGILVATTGLGLVFRDYLASFLAGLILRANKKIKPGARVKVMVQPNMVLKGDVISIGPIRTSLHEVGDGEHLPSVLTGRIVKVPNAALVNSPIVIYGKHITDEVVGFEMLPSMHLDTVEEDMRAAIEEAGHQVVGVGLYQREDKLVVHGIFREQAMHQGDSRSRIIKGFLLRRSARQASATEAAEVGSAGRAKAA
jgi:hypothetical protein